MTNNTSSPWPFGTFGVIQMKRFGLILKFILNNLSHVHFRFYTSRSMLENPNQPTPHTPKHAPNWREPQIDFWKCNVNATIFTSRTTLVLAYACVITMVNSSKQNAYVQMAHQNRKRQRLEAFFMHYPGRRNWGKKYYLWAWL